MKTMFPFNVVVSLENAKWLDPAADAVRTAVKTTIRPQWLRDILHGVPLGHPLHPLLIQVPIGAWLSAAVLDLIPGTAAASKVLVGTGLAAAVPAAISGFVDWSDTHEQQLRVGLIHSTANVVGVGLYTTSLCERVAGRQDRGKIFGLAGLLVVGVSGFLGGHLAYRQAAGANHAEDVPHRMQPGWHDIGPLADLVENDLTQRVVGEIPVVVLRRGSRVDVLSDVCSHLSGPLHQGELRDLGGAPCVVCPWHQSIFSMRTGEVVHGPATAPQACFQTRLSDGNVEVSLPGAG
ncbi:MAG: Rieske 2Fe-2S domain-containing protein [Microlunatus sp.]|nr:Rieske 2Fe-2S domain-containing protein [Microlunatus sp.]